MATKGAKRSRWHRRKRRVVPGATPGTILADADAIDHQGKVVIVRLDLGSLVGVDDVLQGGFGARGPRPRAAELREVLRTLLHEDLTHIQQPTRLFLRDCVDHVTQLIELVEAYPEVSGGLFEMNLSMASQRMNEVMKLLTMIATIFIPLGFVAGLYGMNFNPKVSRLNMPELNWRWGYSVVLSAMVVIATGMLLYFHRRGWLSKSD